MLRSFCAISKVFILSSVFVAGSGILSGCGDSGDATGTALKEDEVQKASRNDMEAKIKDSMGKAKKGAKPGPLPAAK